jgi:hypothetical protein
MKSPTKTKLIQCDRLPDEIPDFLRRASDTCSKYDSASRDFPLKIQKIFRTSWELSEIIWPEHSRLFFVCQKMSLACSVPTHAEAFEIVGHECRTESSLLASKVFRGLWLQAGAKLPRGTLPLMLLTARLEGGQHTEEIQILLWGEISKSDFDKVRSRWRVMCGMTTSSSVFYEEMGIGKKHRKHETWQSMLRGRFCNWIWRGAAGWAQS